MEFATEPQGAYARGRGHGGSREGMCTLLSSCVSVLPADSRRAVGAMCQLGHVGSRIAGNVHNTACGLAGMERMFAIRQNPCLGAATYRAVSWTDGREEPKLDNVSMEQGGFQWQ